MKGRHSIQAPQSFRPKICFGLEGEWKDGCKSHIKDRLQQSKMSQSKCIDFNTLFNKDS
jgi:hypothetical protein